MERTPPAKPDSDRFDRELAIVRRSFGDLLALHLFRLSTRPAASGQAQWSLAEFAERLSGSFGAGTITPQTVEEWLNGASLPDDQTTFPAILQLLFGEDPALSDYRASLADFFEQAKLFERSVRATQDTVRIGHNPSARTAIISKLGTVIATGNPFLRLSPDDTWDIARLDQDLQTLKAAKLPPDSVIYAETETGFAIVQGQATDAAVAAQPATAQRHRNVIAKIEDLIDACGTRLDNQRSWRRLPQIAKRALEAANRPTIELPDALVDLYDHTVSLGSYVSQDDAIGADKNASDAPLDHDIRRALVDFISSASPWLRSFPSVLAADDARREFLTRPELFEPIRSTLPAAREFLEIAGKEGVLSPEDAARATLPIETAGRGGVLGEKAGYRGHGNALGLLTRAATVSIVSLIGFYSGAIASDFATKSVRVQRAGSFLARAEGQALQLAASAPDDLRIALENVLKINRLRQEGDPPPQTPAIMPADSSKSFRPPLEPLARWREPIPGLPEEAWPDMVTLPAGEFVMGAPANEAGSLEEERPQRRVTVPRPFAIGSTAVTFNMWDAALANGFVPTPISQLADDLGIGREFHPVVQVNWRAAKEFCAWLNRRLGLAPSTWRLPSEAEWEYACRAGTTTPYNVGSTISATQANFDPASLNNIGTHRRIFWRGRSVPVGSLPPNQWGLYEMHGNVAEWVEDGYDSYPDQETDSRPLSVTGTLAGVLRGGTFLFDDSLIRSASRYASPRAEKSADFGFRLARTLT